MQTLISKLEKELKPLLVDGKRDLSAYDTDIYVKLSRDELITLIRAARLVMHLRAVTQPMD